MWLVADPARRNFLNRSVLTVEWDAENLVERKEEITSKNLGAEQIMD